MYFRQLMAKLCHIISVITNINIMKYVLQNSCLYSSGYGILNMPELSLVWNLKVAYCHFRRQKLLSVASHQDFPYCPISFIHIDNVGILLEASLASIHVPYQHKIITTFPLVWCLRHLFSIGIPADCYAPLKLNNFV